MFMYCTVYPKFHTYIQFLPCRNPCNLPGIVGEEMAKGAKGDGSYEIVDFSRELI